MRSTGRKLISGARAHLLILLACLLAALAIIPATQARPTPVTGGTFTSVNQGTDGLGTCLNGTGLINCNHLHRQAVRVAERRPRRELALAAQRRFHVRGS